MCHPYIESATALADISTSGQHRTSHLKSIVVFLVHLNAESKFLSSTEILHHQYNNNTFQLLLDT